MSVPVGQMLAVLRHVAIQRLRGNDRTSAIRGK